MALVTFEYVRMNILCVYFMLIDTVHILLAFLVSFVHPTLSKCPNQTSTFILMSIFIIHSGVNSGHGIGDLLCMCILSFHIMCVATSVIGTIFIAFKL